MVRYFYAWIPVVCIWALFLLSLPGAGLIALLVVLCAVVLAVAALAWALIASVHALSHIALGHLGARRSRAWRETRRPLGLDTRGLEERVTR